MRSCALCAVVPRRRTAAPCAPLCSLRSSRGSSDSDSELYQSEASESTASDSENGSVPPLRSAAILRRSFSAFSSLRLRIAILSLRSNCSS